MGRAELGSGTALAPGEKRDHEQRVASFARTINELERLTDGRRLLDVGCGPGALVVAARRRGWQAKGVEPDARTNFLIDDVICSEWTTGIVPASSIDVVTMVEVIEHVSDPVSALSAAHEALVDGGILHLTAPNYGTVDRFLWTRTRTLNAIFDPPHHRFVWAGRDLVRLVERVGFDVIVARCQVSRLLQQQGGRMMSGRPDAGSIVPSTAVSTGRWVEHGTNLARKVLPGASIRLYARR